MHCTVATIESYETKGGKRWRVRYRTPDRRQTDKRGFKLKRDAEQFANTVEVSKHRGEWIDPADSRITVGELGATWINNRNNLKPSTFRTTESAWRIHVEPRWGKTKVSDVRFSEIETWIGEMSKARSATTVLRAHGVLLAILAGAVRDRRILSNPAEGVALPRKRRKQHVYLSHEQLHALANASGSNRTLVLVLGYTGIRWGEMAGLRVRDVDQKRRRLHVERNAVTVGSRIEVGTPKSHKRRSVPVPAFLLPLLEVQCDNRDLDAPLFTSPRGGFIKRPRLYGAADVAMENSKHSWFTNALRSADLEYMTLHDLRHTAASLAVSAGANVKAVQKMLGHASAAMTLDVYADLFDDDLDAVGAALDHAVSISGVGKMWAKEKISA